MTCLCLESLLNLWPSLSLMANLKIGIPPVMAQLAAVVGTSAPAGTSSASLAAALSLNLPLLPLSMSLVDQISLSVAAAAQISAQLGFSLTDTPSMMSFMASLNVNLAGLLGAFPMIPLALSPLSLSAILNLSMALSTIASFRAMFGLDLLLPSVALNLNMALRAALGAGAGAGFGLGISASMMANLSAYAKLAAAINLMGGFPNFMLTLQAMARLQIPGIFPNWLALLANLLALRQAAMNIQAVLGLDPFAVNLALMLQAKLQPLSLIANLSLQESLGMAGMGGLMLGANFAMQAQAIAQMNLSALLSLRLPNLAPLSLVANFAFQAGVAAYSPCSPNCPIGGRW
jgi:hypothetical protein